jgi:Ser/Thr protein kinase RdoA (MazF antagonist)
MDFQKANFSNKDILNILKLYLKTKGVVEISELNGIANNNYRIKGNDFDLVLKAYSHGQSDHEKIQKEIQAISLFEKSGLLVPQLVKGENGEILQKYNGFYIVASKFINGKVFDTIEFTDVKMLSVGKIVAQVETIAQKIDVSKFSTMSFREEFDYVSSNLEKEIKQRGYLFDLKAYKKNQFLIDKIIEKLDASLNKQFLHKDIWPWDLIDSTEGVYLLDFNDWSIGNPIIELSVAILEFGMFKSDQMNFEVVKKIIEGYKSIKELTYSASDLWESVLFICYLYFAYNVVQADDIFESEIYLKRIDTLLKNPKLFDKLI